MKYDTKIAVVVRDDLETWQKLNVTAFLMGGIGGTRDVVGKPYVDGSDNEYLPLIQQPVLVFTANREQMKTVYERAMRRGLDFNIYTEELFKTYNDEDNRATVKAVKSEDLNLVGMALHGPKNGIDRTLKGLELHP